MNQVLVATLVAVSIIASGAYAASLITEISATSTASSDIDNDKRSESIRAVYDGMNITVENTGKVRSEIVFLRFYDNTGREVSRIMVDDKTNRNFGADIPILSPNKIQSNHGVLERHRPQSFSPSQLGVTLMDDMSGEIITKYGNVFAIQKPETLSNEETADGNRTSILDGLGVSLSIENINANGKAYFGNGIQGLQTDIREYIGVGINDDWVAVIQDDDPVETLLVPEFAKEYRYESGILVEIKDTPPNILGYSASKSLSGTVSVVAGDAGMFFSGDGELILELHNYHDQPLFLRGDGSSGSVLKIITSSHDLINEPYVEQKGYLTYSADINPETDSFSVVAGIDSTHTGVLLYDAHAFGKPYNNGHSLLCINVHTNLGYTSSVTKISNFLCDYTLADVRTTTDLVKTNNGDHMSITGDSTLPAIMLYPYFHTQYNDNFVFNLYDTLPSVQRFGFAGAGSFEKQMIFPSEQTYLYVKLNGGESRIKGEAFDPASDVFFKVYGLLADTAYDISKNAMTRVVGKTDSDGEISLFYDDVHFASASPGGILKMYPESVKYTDELGAGMIDLLHKATTRLPFGDDLVYVPQNYVRWVFPVRVEVEDVSVDNIRLDYLNRDYAKNEALLVPVIPSAHTIHATINGADAEVLMRDVSTSTRLKHVPQKTAITSGYGSNGASSISSNISTSTFLTATHLGVMNVNFDFKVAASADFTMDSSYVGEFTSQESCTWHGASSPYRTESCRIYNSPASPNDISNMHSLTAEHQRQLIHALDNGQASHLTVEVDIFQNMQYVKTILLNTITVSQAHVTSTFSQAGYDASNKVRIVYPLSAVSDQIAVPVEVGDMMEFVVRVNLDASGAPAPTSSDAAYTSYVIATTEFGGGIITVGMS